MLYIFVPSYSFLLRKSSTFFERYFISYSTKADTITKWKKVEKEGSWISMILLGKRSLPL